MPVPWEMEITGRCSHQHKGDRGGRVPGRDHTTGQHEGLGFALSPPPRRPHPSPSRILTALEGWQEVAGRGAVVPHSSPQIVTGLLGLANGPYSYFIFFTFMDWSMSAGRRGEKEDKNT